MYKGLTELVRNPLKVKTTDKNIIVFDNNNLFLIDDKYYIENTLQRTGDSASNFSFKYIGLEPETIGIKIGNIVVYETDNINLIDLEIPFVILQFQNISLFAKYNKDKFVLNKEKQIIVEYNFHYFDNDVRQILLQTGNTIIRDNNDKEIIKIKNNLAGRFDENEPTKWHESRIINLLNNVYSENEDKICIQVDNLRRGSYCYNYKFTYSNRPDFIRLYICGQELYRTDNINEFNLSIPFVNLQYHDVLFVFEFNKSKCKLNSQLRIDYTVDNTIPDGFNVNEPVALELPNYPKDIIMFGGMANNCPKKGTSEFKEQFNKLVETHKEDLLKQKMFEQLKETKMYDLFKTPSNQIET